MTPEEQGTRNIALLGRHLEYLLDHPEALADVDGAELVLAPIDDPELAAANAALVERLKATSPGAEDAPAVHLLPA